MVADAFGLTPAQIRVVTEMDTARDAWSIASGNYSSRFAAAVAGAAHIAATRLREKLARIAAAQLGCQWDEIEFVEGTLRLQGGTAKPLPFARVASASHWAPGTLPDGVDHAIRETAFWTPPQLTAPDGQDGVNSSLCHGFIFDFCGVEIDRDTAQVRIDKYVTMHDCGRILHPGMVAGQVNGGYAHALGAALYEEHSYGEDGSFLSGTLADYLVPTVCEVVPPLILHHETPSPFTPLGAKGVGEGNCMSTPVCLANAVADALSIADVELPLLPSRLAPHLHGQEAPPSRPLARKAAPPAKPGERKLIGEGVAKVAAPRQQVWDMLLDADTLASVIPGAHGIEKPSPTEFTADVTLGIGPVKGRYKAKVGLHDLQAPESLTLKGTTTGALGFGNGSGAVTLAEPAPGQTEIHYRYEVVIGGKVASIGGRLLDGAAKVVIGQLFDGLAAKAGGGSGGLVGWCKRVLRKLGVGL